MSKDEEDTHIKQAAVTRHTPSAGGRQSNEVWGLEASYMLSQMNTIHRHFMNCIVRVCKCVPDSILFCELARVPLQRFWQKMTLKYVSRRRELPADRLVKKAFTHVPLLNTPWWTKLSSWLRQYALEGVPAEGTFSISNAEKSTNGFMVVVIYQQQRSARS